MSEVRVVFFYPKEVMDAWNWYRERIGRLLEIQEFSEAELPYVKEIDDHFLLRSAQIAAELEIEENDNGRDTQ
jgi:hypothetical protein